MMATLLALLSLAVPAQRPTRAEFAKSMAKVHPGMAEEEVRKLLGEPDDVRTELDPGGINAAQAVKIWRYGAEGHRGFATLGQVHLDAQHRVVHACGGAPPAATELEERALREILQALDGAPSYNAGWAFDPLGLIRAVNVLQPLGKKKALAAIAEYLRGSSPLEDPACEGMFLVLRVLFDAPPDLPLPPMLVGAAVPQAPKDPKDAPRFPIALAGDVPVLLVEGYELGGKAQSPRAHLDWFAEHGLLRGAPLRPVDDPLSILGQLPHDDARQAFFANQILQLLDSVIRVEPDVYGARFSAGKDVGARLASLCQAVAKLKIHWDAGSGRYLFADGKALPAPAAAAQRIIWKLALVGPEAQLILQRKSSRYVRLEVRVHWIKASGATPSTVRLWGDDPAKPLAEAVLTPRPPDAWNVQSQTLELPAGGKVHAACTSSGKTATSAIFVP